ncbi:MAG: hypothetical protein IJ083_12055 [Clostridia bacterium]|nr:hypothetical protein [Clostridia bacterium]
MENALTYEEFIQAVRDDLIVKKGYPPENVRFYAKGSTPQNPRDADSARRWNRENHGAETAELEEDMLIIGAEDAPMTSQVGFALLRAYEKYQRDGWDATQKTLDQMDGNVRNLQGSIMSYESCVDRLIIRPLNFRKHQAELRDAIYRRIGDIALVLYLELGSQDHNYMTMKVLHDHVAIWGGTYSDERLLSEAMENTEKKYPAVVGNLKTLEELRFMEDVRTLDQCTFQDMIMMSNTNSVNGAIAIFYPDVQAKLLELYGGPFYVVFANTSDVFVSDGRRPVPTLARDLVSSGATNGIGESLSNKTYKFDGKRFFYV